MYYAALLNCNNDFFPTATCVFLTDPNNGTINCSLGDDEVPSYEDTCSFTCNTGYELRTGNGNRTCQNNGSWSGDKTECVRGMIHIIELSVYH